MNRDRCGYYNPEIKDYGMKPVVVNIDQLSKINQNFRAALWTGNNLQVTLMSIPVGGDIGVEIHPNVDQFIRVEKGCALILMGERKNALEYQQRVDGDYAVLIPAGTWHNILNIGNMPLKLYSIYAPPQHPYGTVHETKKVAEAEEKNNC